MLRSVRPVALAAALWLVAAGVGTGQAIGQGFELERAGRPEQAAEIYFATLRADPINLPALLGLERALPQLGRRQDLLPFAERAVSLDSMNNELQGVLLRQFVNLNEPDSVRAVVGRWTRNKPGDMTPYREWAIALEEGAAFGAAADVLLAGRQALGEPTAFAIDLAELRSRLGDWPGAAHEWATAVTVAPVQVPTAAAQLVEAPQTDRGAITQLLTGASASVPARRLAAELLLSWGDATEAWRVFAVTVPARSIEAASALHRFADLAGAPGTQAAWRVRGLALGRYADMVPEQLAVRARADAARAFLQAGDARAARAELERVAADSAAPQDAQQLAHAALIRALIQDGHLDSAAARLGQAGDRLAANDRSAARFALARARIGRGELSLAESALANDSSVEALALYSWIALYRGDLKQARALLRAAGPYAGERRDATQRTAMLAMIERITPDRVPALGSALLRLARGDSAGAVTALRGAADQLTPARGRGDVLLFAGQIAARVGGGNDAEGIAASLFDEVVRTEGRGTGAAPAAAELAWARLLVQQGRDAEAVQHLEHLILTYPGSAVVPEARRELERVKGAIPKS